MPNWKRKIRRAAWRVVAPYLVFGIAWILLSDGVAEEMAGVGLTEHLLQSVKGLAFVVTTAGLLYLLCVRRFAALAMVERELRESERRFSSMMHNLQGMAYQCLADAGWTMLFASRGAEALTGYRVEDLVHNRSVRFADLIHPEDRDRVRAEVGRAVSERGAFGLEYRLVNRDGSVRWVWEQGLVVPGPDSQAVLLEGFISDITDRKALEEVEDERRLLVESRRAVEEALGAIGHELRTPLASPRLLAEALLDPELAEGERLEYARGILEQTERLTEMATNMLEGARLRDEHAVWKWGGVDLRQVIESAVAVMLPLASRSGVRVEARYGPGDLSVYGDADALRRLVLNLLSNACRHSPSGLVEVHVSRFGSGASIEVRDNGRGMSPEVMAKLGRAFALSSGPVSSDASAGAGLGLAICRQIVAAHWGQIGVASRQGAGTTITVSLPADRAGPRKSFEPEPIRLAA